MCMKRLFSLSMAFFLWCAIITSIVGCSSQAYSNFEYYDLPDNASPQQITYASKVKQLCETLLKDPNTFDDPLTDAMVDLNFEVIESPDKGLKIYTWYNGEEEGFLCYHSLYQLYRNGKFRSGVLEDWTMKPKTIHQVWSKGDPVYLVRVQSEYEDDIYEDGLKACCLAPKGKLQPAKVFPNLDYNYSDGEEEEDYTDYLYFDAYGLLPPSAFYDGGWTEDFFFSNDEKELYMPYVKTEMDAHCSYGIFNDMYHYYSWDGECFLHHEIVFNPQLELFINEGELVCEFPLGQSNIRIDKDYTGTYRYLAWKKDKMFSEKPDLEVHDGWYHEVKKEFYFENENYKYVFNTETLHLTIYHFYLPIADYEIDANNFFTNM